MRGLGLSEMNAFVAIAERASFAKAAAHLGVSRSSLSETIRAPPDYLARHPAPKAPVDLQSHNCIRMRFASGAVARWTFEKRGKSLEVLVTGSLITSDGDLALRAALDGAGIARLPVSSVE